MFWLQEGYQKRGYSEFLESKALLRQHKILEVLILPASKVKIVYLLPREASLQYVQYFQALKE